jgi:hypothetical protein
MKNRKPKNNALRINSVTAIAFIGLLLSTPLAKSATVFSDNFEDGNAVGWQETIVGNSAGSTGVESHNGSLMAFAKDTGATSFSLSHDFNYVSDQTLAFTMQAIANANPCCDILEASSGVTISFLDVFNSTLGSVTIANASNSALTDILVDTAQHDYSASMGVFATQAGLNPASTISKLNLNFFAYGETYGNVSGVAHSTSSVWFDNVNVSAVPVPAAAWLFGTGLVGLIGVARRKTA